MVSRREMKRDAGIVDDDPIKPKAREMRKQRSARQWQGSDRKMRAARPRTVVGSPTFCQIASTENE
jgi:hypothetical protein